MAAKKTLSEGTRIMVLSEALRLFLPDKEVGGLSSRTTQWYKACLEKFIEFIGDKPIAKLTA